MLRVTDNSKATTLFDGEEYLPTSAPKAEAAQKSYEAESSNTRILAAISSDLITAADVRKGLYRNAEVIEMVYDRRAPWEGNIQKDRYWITGHEFSDEDIIFQVEGIESRFDAPVGRVVSRSCKNLFGAAFGDSEQVGCHFDINGNSLINVDIAEVITQRRIFEVVDPDTTLPADYYAGGYVRFTNGLNSGIVDVARRSTKSSGRVTIELYLETPFDIDEATDQVTVEVGCNRGLGRDGIGHCATRHFMVRDFKGEPDAPGPDELIKPATEA